MPISVYDINTYLTSDSELANTAGKVMSFFPVVGYGDETAPFVIYFYSPSIPSVEAYWQRRDNIRYSIYDTDVDRLFSIGERMIYLLGRGDQIQKSGGPVPNNVRVLSTQLVTASSMEPIEKLGWYQMDLDFSILSVDYS
jgi:hypothetical protein